MKQNDKTNVMRLLDAKKIPYVSHAYEPNGRLTGAEIAERLGERTERVFKTLVTVGKTGDHYVFVIPVLAELDLKKAARAVGEKSIDMIRQKELLPLTGYVHGGCSPVGMKKPFPTCIHETAAELETICVSAGKVGFQIELAPQDLAGAVRYTLADLVVDTERQTDIRVRRITEMEARLDRVEAWLEDPVGDVSGDVHILDAYYHGPLWRSDLEADEAGRLPADLPRGVLSEDGIDHALEAYEEKNRSGAARP